MKIVIIDYDSGNLASVSKAFERAAREEGLSADILVSRKPEEVFVADRVVLPGVGAFADCRKGLFGCDGMVAALEEVIHQKARPFLGICVGHQLMAEHGLEKQVTEGLGWIKGNVREIEPANKNFKIPHMGWNTLDLNKDHPVFSGIKTGQKGLHAYFVHSYHMIPDEDVVLATSNYGGEIVAAVAKDNLVGTQFHPEKSQTLGLALIANFLKWTA